MADQIYWNPVLETLPRKKILKLQLKKFRKIFEWTYERSKFHRKIYDEAGIKPDEKDRRRACSDRRKFSSYRQKYRADFGRYKNAGN